MNKKLVKTRNARLNTLEAMACACGCGCECDCTNCSGGGSWTVTERTNRSKSSRDDLKVPISNIAILKG